MQQLAEIQCAMRHAVVVGDYNAVAHMLAVGTRRAADPKSRLRIHRRQYETSLITALLEKFPATVWLVGSDFMTETAQQYVRAHPPQRPCIAEYGEAFPDFIADSPGAQRLPYLRDFGKLEWQVGHVAISIDQTPVLPAVLAAIPSENAADTLLRLQPGLRYLTATWPVDDLLKVCLSEAAPERLEFEPRQIWLEVHGGRGEFRLERLPEAEFTFRRAIAENQSIGDALERALAIDPSLDPERALATLFANGLVTAIEPNDREVS